MFENFEIFPAGQVDSQLSPSSEEIPHFCSWLHHLHSSAQNHWSDEVILYFTLVADKVVPDGFLSDFLHLSRWISSAAHRQASRLAHVTDVEAALFVHTHQVQD